ncbi:MAG TPA: hypothetical protein VHR55_03545 [Candidatus Limnocylindria bacterium]|nr:hypothetical protein [Candidatus Limnocylindria bacterium]
MSSTTSVEASRRLARTPTSSIGLRAIAGPGGAALHGFGVAVVVMGVAVAAFVGQNLHLATPIGDAAIGVALVALPVLLLLGIVRLVGWVLRSLLNTVAQRVPAVGPTARLTERVTRVAGRPLLIATLVLAALVLAAPEEGPLAMYRSLRPFEVLFAAAAVVGPLAGIGRWALGAPAPGPSRRAVAIAALVPALVIAGVVGGWALYPGSGDPLAVEDPAVLAAVPQLDLDDPSETGPHAVAAASYGSDVAWRRPEFGPDADWRTPTVDASGALEDRPPVADFFSNLLWGHDDSTLPINGLAWYPESATGPMPVALIVHGNHAAGDFSDPGYAYLGEHLASHGIFTVSVDENYLNGDAFFDYGGAEQGVRAWMLLRHLEQLATWNADPDHPLHGRLDLQRVALIGHSRGGEAATVAAMLEASDDAIAGLPPVPRGFGIRAVVGIAPSDGQYAGPGTPVRLTDVDYLVLQGAHDGDLPAFSGLATYHRVAFTGEGDHLKAAIYSQRANHGRFNSVWDTGDAGPLTSWLLDRGSLLSAAEQQDLARGVIGAFLQRSLFDRAEYDTFFRDPRAGRAWLPDDVVLSQWETSARLTLADFTYGIGSGETVSGFDEAREVDPMLRDVSPQGDHALHLEWSGPGVVTVEPEAGIVLAVNRGASIVLSLAVADERPVDPVVDLELTDGRHVAAALADVTGIRPRLPTQLWKIEALGARYLPEERLAWPAERFLQTYAIPLTAFGLPENGAEIGLARITVRVDGYGDAYLDDIGFEPGW